MTISNDEYRTRRAAIAAAREAHEKYEAALDKVTYYAMWFTGSDAGPNRQWATGRFACLYRQHRMIVEKIAVLDPTDARTVSRVDHVPPMAVEIPAEVALKAELAMLANQTPELPDYVPTFGQYHHLYEKPKRGEQSGSGKD
jgi:hypothetical protein